MRLTSFPSGGLAVVVGASGGIGAAVAAAIGSSGRFAHVIEASRSGQPSYDITREDHVAALAEKVKASGHDLRLAFDATGYLHGAQGGPEKSWSAIDPAALAHQFAVNTIGPALLIKHLLPLFSRDGKAVFATISAKVGSISDNQLGGWYGYRSAKAALNQIVKTASIELARKRPEAICLALHPGTVATPLSDPFAKNGIRLQTPQESAASMLQVINNASTAQSGQLVAYDGKVLPY
ncbi:MAG: SDR family NAD(P)-dependent oxidoreductase [Rhizobiales bacterium]|nr:SDR family NAD(P)-dependent oxidoreductase [Hyphomicrobiales bacterium]MBO6700098.1 SDR family NAD(P)-dependent oxidoreductase [Hyphomicrobiales bacterium]MBO6737737.1 SDR family NAD(P)-dependent oxidoreductase [Hyphomicrobiales bacterium]MBO6913206.1 SDR family NAD(P)-dependent oxidoreductase [Hyphomicrobiales bacterium]MBO6954250.1 SDR family NAD(P)-dependent oxidoreductase [Hyphomicrobiales bacterium]